MLCILKNRNEIMSARRMLAKRGLDVLPTRFGNLLRKLRLTRTIAVGDAIKGWDILKTVDFISGNFKNNVAVLDMGAFSSEILLLLLRLGYTDLTGIDLNPQLTKMPSPGSIRYNVGNFLESTYSDGCFNAISAISVIEHGYEGEKLFREVSRLLAPGGFFIASFDYWPEKTDSGNERPFGLSWTVFSQDEVREMLVLAANHGLEPVGALDYCAQDKTIEWGGRQYTFAWLALQKSIS
jgi:SAM-dependent methyltransferase